MNVKSEFIDFFERVWNENKAKGLAAQIYLEDEMRTGKLEKHSEKLFSGCWLLSPNALDSYKFRLCFFVHNSIVKNPENELNIEKMLGDYAEQFFATAEFMNNVSIGVVYAIPTINNDSIDFNSISQRDFSFLNWNLFYYENKKLVKKNESELFEHWAGRGRPTYRKTKWIDTKIRDAFEKMKIEQLESMLANELFYTGYL